MAIDPDYHEKVLFFFADFFVHVQYNEYKLVKKQNLCIWRDPQAIVEAPSNSPKIAIGFALWAEENIVPCKFNHVSGQWKMFQSIANNIFVPEQEDIDSNDLWFQQYDAA